MFYFVLHCPPIRVEPICFVMFFAFFKTNKNQKIDIFSTFPATFAGKFTFPSTFACCSELINRYSFHRHLQETLSTFDIDICKDPNQYLYETLTGMVGSFLSSSVRNSPRWVLLSIHTVILIGSSLLRISTYSRHFCGSECESIHLKSRSLHCCKRPTRDPI